MILKLPIPGFVSVIGFAAFRLTGDGVPFTPGFPSGLVWLAFLTENEFRGQYGPGMVGFTTERPDRMRPR